MDIRAEARDTIHLRGYRHCRILSVSTGTFYSWKKKYKHKGEEGLMVTYDTKSKELKQAGLLKLDNRINRSVTGRKLLKYREMYITKPLGCLEMDIKMVWIPNAGKNAYLLSVIDVHTRRILKDYFSFNVKQKDVISLLSLLLEDYEYPESVVIRSDNGSQFIAKRVRKYLAIVGVSRNSPI